MPKSFWGRFVRNRPAVFGLAFLVFVVLLSLAAPLLFPGDPFRIVGKTFLPPFGAYLFGTGSPIVSPSQGTRPFSLRARISTNGAGRPCLARSRVFIAAGSTTR